MNGATPLPLAPACRIAALIVAAGQGLRAGGDVPKQFAEFRGKPLLRHSVEAFAAWTPCDQILVVTGAAQRERAAAALDGVGGVAFITGGAERRDSVRLGLLALAERGGAQHVYIHDAARPGLTSAVLDRLDAALADAPGAIPVLPVVDTLTRGEDATMTAAVDRAGIWRVQTPQAFAFRDILAAHLAWSPDAEATDDARIAQAAGMRVVMVEGDEALRKITFAADLAEDRGAVAMIARTGMGYDVHRLVAREELWLGGIRIPHGKGLAGHSDADVALHALTDALLGAMALGDIGEHFPPSDPQWRGADSARFLAHAGALVRAAGGKIANVDLTIICEAPKIGPHKPAIQARIAAILELRADQVAVKATTTERLGFAGRGEGIAAQAVASVMVRARD